MLTIDLKFRYNGFWRRVSNITFEPETDSFIGFEMRKNGKFVYRIKRYSMEKVSKLSLIEPFERNGPRIGI